MATPRHVARPHSPSHSWSGGRWRRSALVMVLAVAATAGCTIRAADPIAAPSPATTFVAGDTSLRDPFTPGAGNGGYDVRSYDLDLRYDPASDKLSGTAKITATATENLSRF